MQGSLKFFDDETKYSLLIQPNNNKNFLEIFIIYQTLNIMIVNLTY